MSTGKELEQAKSIIDNYIIYATQEYKNVEEVIQRLINYCYGDNNIITRKNHFRELFVDYVTKEKIDIITNYNIELYVKNLINTLNDNGVNKTNIANDFNEGYNKFFDITCQIYNEYGINYLKESLYAAMRGKSLHFDGIIKPENIQKFIAYYLKARNYDVSKPMDIVDTYTIDLSAYIFSQNNNYKVN